MTVSDEIRARYEESEQVAVFEWAELARPEFPELEYPILFKVKRLRADGRIVLKSV